VLCRLAPGVAEILAGDSPLVRLGFL